ncbi:hypothetical protein MG293_004793 [Ovis ammon polii]|uniref:Uncharacterized protein n=1 Tax=Ovis ammon polii TaxID=230172 RepID=A0AAD4YEM9_OVIAM|nr:hypothetical protein MG293_004793 [Ovis ammon polii]
MVMEPDALAEFAAAAHVHKDLMDRFLEPMDVDSFSGRGGWSNYRNCAKKETIGYGPEDCLLANTKFTIVAVVCYFISFNNDKVIYRSQVAPKTMNLSSEHCNMSDWLRLEATVKVSVYMVAFSFATLITVIIITIISQNSKLRKEVRYILLCHHLLCISSYCGLGVVFQGMRAFLANSPILVCWVVFGAQLSVGEGILFTLALMAAHTYLMICWPLTSVSFIDSTKYKILAGTWLIIILKNACLFLIEGTGPTQIALLKSEPLCPVVLNGIPARAIGMVFLFLLLSIILPQYNEGTWQPLQGNFTFRDDANIQRKLHNECKHFNSLATDPQQNILKTRLSDVLLTAAQE